ncbi:putative mini-chromosome maintenance complex-binding protein [Helianthus annuus]|nr:putative mini-chromosome maintenance complex-binding protein [Helianthus annuus]KAJ0865462.1 putative mini-chromosome maintenance complex-binding protein [Helianthus annuus]
MTPQSGDSRVYEFQNDDFLGFMIVTTFLNNPAVLRVPILTHSTVKWVQANSLVRFHGVIQDMLGNECYVGAYKNEGTWNTNNSQMFLNFLWVIPRIPASGIVGCSYVYL